MKEELWHCRHAVQIVSALPEAPEDALSILRLAMQLVTGFLAGSEAAPKPHRLSRSPSDFEARSLINGARQYMLAVHYASNVACPADRAERRGTGRRFCFNAAPAALLWVGEPAAGNSVL